MIAKYKDKYFNISLAKKPTRIWRYDFIEGFQKKVKDDGLVVYEKFVDIDDINCIIDVGFSANWHGKLCGAVPLVNNEIQLITNDRQFAQQYGMEEFEREVFWCSVGIDECEEFSMEIEDILKETSEVQKITSTELICFYQRFVLDLLPPN